MAIKKSVKRDKLMWAVVVPTRRICNNMGNVISKGTPCAVTDIVQGRGLTIESIKCSSCGQSTKITGVKRECLDFYDPNIHEQIFLPQDVQKLLKDISRMLEFHSGQSFESKYKNNQEYESVDDWYDNHTDKESVTEQEYRAYERQIEAYEMYKRIQKVLGK